MCPYAPLHSVRALTPPLAATTRAALATFFGLAVKYFANDQGMVLPVGPSLLRVTDVLPSGAVARHGVIKPGDVVIAIDGVPVSNQNLPGVKSLIRGDHCYVELMRKGADGGWHTVRAAVPRPNPSAADDASTTPMAPAPVTPGSAFNGAGDTDGVAEHIAELEAELRELRQMQLLSTTQKSQQRASILDLEAENAQLRDLVQRLTDAQNCGWPNVGIGSIGLQRC